MLLKGGCCRQVSIVVSLVLRKTDGCYCKVVAVGSQVQSYLWYYGKQVDVGPW